MRDSKHWLYEVSILAFTLISTLIFRRVLFHCWLNSLISKAISRSICNLYHSLLYIILSLFYTFRSRTEIINTFCKHSIYFHIVIYENKTILGRVKLCILGDLAHVIVVFTFFYLKLENIINSSFRKLLGM